MSQFVVLKTDEGEDVPVNPDLVTHIMPRVPGHGGPLGSYVCFGGDRNHVQVKGDPVKVARSLGGVRTVVAFA